MSWAPINTAPRNTAFLGRADGMVAVCIVYDTKDKVVAHKRWPWSKPVADTRRGGTFIGFGVPSAGDYSILNMRPDHGWAPEEWLPLDEIPW